MPRYIDADELLRNTIYNVRHVPYIAESDVIFAPTADVVEVVRCKDCKHGSPNGKYGCRVYHYRRYETHDMEPDDFCSYAERRTDG